MKSVHHFRISLTLVAALALSGCLDSDSSSSDDTSTGSLTANGISGLSYETASQTGKTGSAGRFRYYPGESVTFRVGDLVLVEDVPAQEFITPLEFFPETRSRLTTPLTDDEGLRTHELTEQTLITNNASLLNLTRFLLALNWTESVKNGSGIDIRERVISQLNAALPNLSEPIDFTVSEADFSAGGNTPSPANQLLAAICFYPDGDELCETPPSLEEIAQAEPRPENQDLRDPDVDYQEDLENRRERILNAVRRVEDFEDEDADNYLTRELEGITRIIGNRYYLDKATAEHSANDTELKTIRIRKINGDPGLTRIEAISTREQDVMVHSFDWQSATVDYFVTASSDGGSEVVISFQPEDTYRWIRKSLRVIIR